MQPRYYQRPIDTDNRRVKTFGVPGFINIDYRI